MNKRIGLFFVPFALSFSLSQSVQAEEMVIVGVTEPIEEITLSAPVHGLFNKIHVQEGDEIKKGALLVEFESESERLQMEVRKLIWKDTSELQAAKTRVRIMKPLLDSAHKLFEMNGSISKEALEKEQLEYEMAVADLSRVQASEKKEKLEYELSKTELKRRLLRAPIGGTITTIHFDEGERCQASEPVIELADVSRGVFVANVEEVIGHRFSPKQVVDLRVRAGQVERLVKGFVTFVSPVVDQASGLIKIKVVFDNVGGKIRPGTSAVLVLNEDGR
jgi:RND family efflux transporter MFP subunit